MLRILNLINLWQTYNSINWEEEDPELIESYKELIDIRIDDLFYGVCSKTKKVLKACLISETYSEYIISVHTRLG